MKNREVKNNIINISNSTYKKYYLYRHIRHDKNEPFYIGVGTKSSSDKIILSNYSRAYCTNPNKRSAIWNYIYNKSNKKITIDILYECDSIDQIHDKEKEFIKLYGRIDKKTGCLSNLTEGGYDRENLKKAVSLVKKKICIYDISGNFSGVFNCGKDLQRFLKCKANSPIYHALKKTHKTVKNYYIRPYNQHFNENIKNIDVDLSRISRLLLRPVSVFDITENTNTTYNSLNDFVTEKKLNPDRLAKYIRGYSTTINKKTFRFTWL